MGLATAYELNRAGHDVTVIDRAMPGSGASGGNGSQLSYSYVQPLADPGIWAQLLKLLLSPSSPHVQATIEREVGARGVTAFI